MNVAQKALVQAGIRKLRELEERLAAAESDPQWISRTDVRYTCRGVYLDLEDALKGSDRCKNT